MKQLSYLIFISASLLSLSSDVVAAGMVVRSHGTASYTAASGKLNTLNFAGNFQFPAWTSGGAVTTTITPNGGSGNYTFSLASSSSGCSVTPNTGIVTATGSGVCSVIISDGVNSITVGPTTIGANNLPPPAPLKPSPPTSVACPLKLCTISGAVVSGVNQVKIYAFNATTPTVPVSSNGLVVNVDAQLNYSTNSLSLPSANGETYIFKIKASNGGGDSDYSDASSSAVVGGITDCQIPTYNNTCGVGTQLATVSEAGNSLCTSKTIPSPLDRWNNPIAIQNLILMQDSGSTKAHYTSSYGGPGSLNGLAVSYIRNNARPSSPSGTFILNNYDPGSGSNYASLCVTKR